MNSQLRRWALNLSTLLFITAPRLSAQVPGRAPVPVQITTAKTIFLSNAGSMDNTYSDEAYDDIYQSLVAWNHYQLQPAPSQAELTMECSLNLATGYVSNGSSSNRLFLQLVIRDARSQAHLWTITEDVAGAFRQKTFQKNIAEAVAKMRADLTALSKGIAIAPAPTPIDKPEKSTTPASDDSKKTRFQQTEKGNHD